MPIFLFFLVLQVEFLALGPHTHSLIDKAVIFAHVEVAHVVDWVSRDKDVETDDLGDFWNEEQIFHLKAWKIDNIVPFADFMLLGCILNEPLKVLNFIPVAVDIGCLDFVHFIIPIHRFHTSASSLGLYNRVGNKGSRLAFIKAISP